MIAYLFDVKRRRDNGSNSSNLTAAAESDLKKERLIRYFARKYILIKQRHMIHFPTTTRVQTMQTNCLVLYTRSFLQLKIMLCRTALGSCTCAYIHILIKQNNLWPCQLAAFRLHVSKQVLRNPNLTCDLALFPTHVCMTKSFFTIFPKKLKHYTARWSQKLHYVMLTYAYSSCNKDLKAIFFLPITTAVIMANQRALYNDQSECEYPHHITLPCPWTVNTAAASSSNVSYYALIIFPSKNIPIDTAALKNLRKTTESSK